MKRVLSAILSLIMIFALLPSAPFVYAAGGDNAFFNADTEAVSGGIFYFADKNSVFSETGDGTTAVYSENGADRIGVSGNFIYILRGSIISRLNIKTLSEKAVITAEKKISRFSKSGSVIYYLSDGKIILFDIIKKNKTEFNAENIKDFWLENANELSYMTDDEYVYTVNLSSGETVKNINMSSYLPDDLEVLADSEALPQASSQKMSLIKLRNKFPDGKYWNHSGSSKNNPDGYTSSPCTHHPNDSGCSYTGSCGCNSFGGAIQCMGYAYKCGYDVTGDYPKEWSTSTSSSKVDSVKAGDVIRYRNDGHSIYVTGVSGDTITYTDCNWGHQCKIRWDATVSKSTVKSSFTKIFIAPFDAGVYKMKLELDGGSCSQSTVTVSDGEPYGTLPVPEKEGYDFNGWFTSASGGTQVTESTVVNLDTTSSLYARWSIKIYNIVYDANGGSNAPEAQTKKYGDSIVLSSKTPQRTGYKFLNWNDAPDGKGKNTYKTSAIYKDNAHITLFAQWEAEQYRLSFNYNGGSNTSLGRNVTYDSPYGELPTSTKTGYDFAGWYTEKDGGELVTAETIVKATGYHTLYAHWSEKKYPIVFYGRGDGAWPDNQYKMYFSSTYISSVKPTSTGATFLSWNTEENGGGQSYAPGDRYDEKAPLTLYAQWDREKYNIGFDANGGSGAPNSMIKEYGISLELSDIIPEKTGYTFKHWNKERSGGGKAYAPGASFTENNPATLYAIWTANSYELYFDPCDGARSFEDKTVTYDSRYGELPEAVRAGYSFLGWFTAKDGGDEITAEDTVKITADTTLYAHWEINTYDVVYVSDGENTPEAQSKIHGTDLKLTAAIPEKEGFDFVEWADESGRSYAPESIYSEDKPSTLYAVWQPAKYNIVYRADGAENVPSAQIKTHGTDAVISSAVPEKAGFVFLGWSDGNGKIYSAGEAFTDNADTVLTAQWKAAEYLLIFADNSERNISYGEKYGEMPAAQKDNSVFIGWFDENGNEIYPENKFYQTENQTLTAKFISEDELSGQDTYYAVFIDGGEIIGKIPYTEETQSIIAPELPQKDGYDGKWADFELAAGGIIVAAIRSPKQYTAIFKADGNEVSRIRYSADDKSLDEPEIPQKTGYSAEWEEYSLGSDIEISAVYTPVEYDAEFIADGKTVDTVKYTVESDKIKLPDVPEKTGYMGEWEGFELAPGGMKIYALYSLEAYTAVFFADGAKVGEVHYTIDTTVINTPRIPEKNGYKGEWESFEFAAGGVEVNAVYTPNKYTVTFTADGETVDTVEYTYGDKSIQPPEIPEKAGYTAEWGEYSLGYENSAVKAIYTPIEYTAVFLADGIEIGRTQFTVETIRLNEPAIPPKDGCYAEWESYVIGAGNMEINAVYRLFHAIDILRFYYERRVDYKTTITFIADPVGMTPECEIHWFKDGTDIGTGDRITVKEAKKNYKIQAKIMENGEILAESRTEKIIVNDSLGQKIKSFFRMIFRALPVIVQE